MESFKRYWQKPGEGVEHRHLKDMVPDANSHSQHPGRTVPEYCKAKQGNVKLNKLKNLQNGRFVLNPSELEELKNTFNVEYTPEHPKKLGNTGITLQFDPKLNSPVIIK